MLKRFTGLSIAIIAMAFLASGVGATNSGSLWSYLFGGISTDQREILTNIRLPRIATALLAGFLIGIAGAVMQRTFANSLAEPTLLGTTAAAAFGSVIAVLLVGTSSASSIAILSAFLAALTISFLTIQLDKKARVRGSNLIIVGIAFAALLNGAIALVAVIAQNEEIRAMSFWSSGTLAFANKETVLSLLVFTVLVIIAIPKLRNILDIFILDDIQLTLTGRSPIKLKSAALVMVSLAVAATTTSVGAVAFLGLAAPYVSRFLFGSSMKLALLGSGLTGALLLLISDTVARSIAAPYELPISVVTSLIGAPFLLFLVMRKRGGWNV